MAHNGQRWSLTSMNERNITYNIGTIGNTIHGKENLSL